MPSIVLTASSIGCTIEVSTSSGEAPGSCSAHCNRRQFNLGMLIESELKVACSADDDDRQHDHRSENRTADTEFS